MKGAIIYSLQARKIWGKQNLLVKNLFMGGGAITIMCEGSVGVNILTLLE